MESLASSLLSQPLDLVHELITWVVSGARVSFSILVLKGRAEELHDSLGRVILTSDQLDAFLLSYILLVHQRLKDWVSFDSSVGHCRLSGFHK